MYCKVLSLFAVSVVFLIGKAICAPTDGNNTDFVKSLKFDENGAPYIDLGEGFKLRIETEEVTGIYKEKAIKELGETPENVEKSLKHMREYLKDEKNLSIPIDDDKFLIRFLRPSKYDAKKAFLRLKDYYSFKLKYKEFTSNIFPSALRHVFEAEYLQVLPNRDKQGRRIYVINVGKWNPDKISKKDLFKALLLGLELALMEPMTQVNGVVFIEDFGGMTFSHVLEISPSYTKMTFDFIRAAPIHIEAIHIVNNSYLFNMVYSIMKPFMDDDFKKKILIQNTNFETVSTAIGKDFLMKKYGGTLVIPECPGKLMADFADFYEKDFKRLDSYGYNKI